MTNTIQRELLLPQPPAEVWQALTDPATLAQWMYPNDFAPIVGHNFTFRVPPNPRIPEGVIIQCQVLTCDPPTRLIFSWSAGTLHNTQVTYRLEPHPAGTRLLFEHANFDLTVPGCEGAMRGLEYGYTKMFEKLEAMLAEAVRGREAAKADIAMGKLEYRWHGHAGHWGHWIVSQLEKRFGVQVNDGFGICFVNARQIAFDDAYNSVLVAAINQQHGEGAFEAVLTESRHQTEEQLGDARHAWLERHPNA